MGFGDSQHYILVASDSRTTSLLSLTIKLSIQSPSSFFLSRLSISLSNPFSSLKASSFKTSKFFVGDLASLHGKHETQRHFLPANPTQY